MGFYLGFGGVLTFYNAKKLKEVVGYMPLERIVLETDCPYMAPAPHRGEKSHSGMIKYTAAKMAELKGVSTEKMIEICRENGERLFRI